MKKKKIGRLWSSHSGDKIKMGSASEKCRLGLVDTGGGCEGQGARSADGKKEPWRRQAGKARSGRSSTKVRQNGRLWARKGLRERWVDLFSEKTGKKSKFCSRRKLRRTGTRKLYRRAGGKRARYNGRAAREKKTQLEESYGLEPNRKKKARKEGILKDEIRTGKYASDGRIICVANQKAAATSSRKEGGE